MEKLEYGKVYDFDFGGCGQVVKGIYIGRLSNRTMSLKDVVIFRKDDGKPYVYRFWFFKSNKNKLNPMEVKVLEFKNNAEEEYANKLLERAGL
jgi:hypothetical protein